MGSIYKRNDIWYVNLRVNSRRVRRKAGKSKHLAQLLLNDLELKAERNQLGFLERKEVPLEEFIQKFLTYSQANNRQSTTNRYKGAMGVFMRFIKEMTHVKRLSDLTTDIIEQFKIWRKSIPVARNGRNPEKVKREHVKAGAKSYTVNFEVMTIKTMLNLAVRWKFLEKNPANGVKDLKTDDSKKRRFLTDIECEWLLQNCPREDYPIFFALLNTGMRRAELVNLEWSDIDFENSLIKIQRKPNWLPKTGEREIPMNEELKSVLDKLSKRSNYVFVSLRGGKMKEDTIRHKLVRIAKAAGLPNLTEVHALRHTFASRLIARGVDLPTVQKLMGHTSIETTMIYTHQTTSQLRDAVEKLVQNDRRVKV